MYAWTRMYRCMRAKVQLYLSSGHAYDSAANRSTLILGEIAARVDKNLGPTCL
jgi:hypothetical protein